MTDKTLMPFGKYLGEQMINVPPGYLIWLYENDRCNGELRIYIKDNMDALKKELKSQQKNYSR
jgi:uncharacterized protein (DUF3820 family)